MKIEIIKKAFKDKIVFENLSIEIPDGQITFIVGKSGSGKTTLLRMIAGLDNDYTGYIEKSSNFISCVFQEPRLFPAITVKQNIEIIQKGTDKELSEILSLVELENEEDEFPNNLSGGMKMRLALARALYHNGDIFLMDEPFSAIDENMKSRIIPKVLELLKGKTVIIISHDIEGSKTYANNLIRLKD